MPLEVMAPEAIVPAPLMLPAEEILIVGVFKKLVKPVAETKLMPLMVLALVMLAAGKLMPLTVLELLALVPVAKVKSRPETAVAPTAPEALVTVADNNLEASVVKEVSVRATIVPLTAVEVTVKPVKVPKEVMAVWAAPVTVAAEPETLPVADPIFGVVKTGELEKTSDPVPVSSEVEEIKFAEVIELARVP